MPHYVYILKSITTQRHYYGETKDLEERVKRHNENRNKSTKNRGPWEVMVTVEVETKTEARKLEHKIKQMKNPIRAIAYLRKLKDK